MGIPGSAPLPDYRLCPVLMGKNLLKKLIEILRLKILILQIRLKIKQLLERKKRPFFWPDYIVIHHEGAQNGFWGVEMWHKHRKFPKSSLGFHCGYQLYLDKGGKWWRARSDLEEGCHCPGKNFNSVGICVMGSYRNKTLEDNLWNVLVNKVDELRAKYEIPREKVIGDKEGRRLDRPTSCPEGLMGFVEWYRQQE